jgi:hypothetical protein
MRKLKTERPAFIPNGEAPVPIGPVSPTVDVPTGEVIPPEQLRLEPPPLPPQFNKPVGPPPPPPELPTDYDGYVELCKRVSRGQMSDKALIWANLAQAEALMSIAEELGRVGDLLEGFAALTEKTSKKQKKPKEG